MHTTDIWLTIDVGDRASTLFTCPRDVVEGLREVIAGQLIDDVEAVEDRRQRRRGCCVLDVASRAVNRMSLEFLLNAA